MSTAQTSWKPVELLCAFALVCVVGHALAADDTRDVRDKKLFRFELDNDTFVGSDNAFTSGESIQIHSQLLDKWPAGLAGWVGRFPTLSDDGSGGRVVRWAWGITQLMMTPDDITIVDPQPNDTPWAGILGGYVSWSAYDDRRLGALQLYLGCLGPCSEAEEVQKFAHDDLGLGDHPAGWANQLENDILVNLNYEYRHKLWVGGNGTRRLGQDLSVGTQVGVGSFATYAEAWLEYRLGWDVPKGFTKLADPPGFGVALDPVYVDPSGPSVTHRTWRPYFNLVVRHRSVDKFAALQSRRTQNGGFYESVISMFGDNQLIFGVHVARLPLAFHLTYYRYFGDNAAAGAIASDVDWVNFSFERRF